ncbi:hypothetical protein [Bacillus cereus]|uniref:hypothetical protein n=1 Tax=Bacillus cereus TaxID=1396 RepID=UPI0018F42B16|nr:hypothetical protein [Bacillus cereus]MBJ7987099.1 hypothetical protein [Bacillus cereus]
MKLKNMEGQHVTLFFQSGMVSTSGILIESGEYGIILEFKDTYEFFSYQYIDRIMMKKTTISHAMK